MAEKLVLKAEKRSDSGTRAARKLRKEGFVPAIIYGHKKDPVSVKLNSHDLALELQHHHRLLDLDVEGTRESCLVKEVQLNYLGEDIVHVDLTRVNVDERVTVSVALEIRGTPVGASEGGGVLNQLMNEIELECVVVNIPASVRVPVKDLQIGDSIAAGDLELPEGAVLQTPAEAPVVMVQAAVEIPEEEEAPEGEEAAAAAEPEVIGTDKEEGEDAGS
ncbi:MAG: 50S ribosomal protein L25 [Planctomycetes bacterium]|nr:50S ribosomal protein L25 [Planctomycetota bacterium]